MSNDAKVIIIACDVLLLIVGFLVMKLSKKAAKKQIEAKFIKGIFFRSDIVGDKVEPSARSGERIGTMFFVFTIVFSFLIGFILYTRW